MSKFNLKKWRQRRGINQHDFAAMIGWHGREGISLVERGVSTKNTILIESFCKLYDIKNNLK